MNTEWGHVMRKIIWVVILTTAAIAGCEDLQRQQQIETEKQRDAALAHAEELGKEVSELSTTVESQKKQIETLQGLGEKRLDNIFTVAAVEISRNSGGIDTDTTPGQDAVVVFLKPLDTNGDVLKAAGDVKIQLFDLAQPQNQTLYAEFTYPAKDISQYWAGGMLSNQYTFRCRFPEGTAPAHPDINLRVTFTDYLTGQTFTAQKLLKLTLPAK